MSDIIEKLMGDLVSRKAVIVMIHEHFQHRIDELPVIETEDGESYDMKSIDAILKDSKALCEAIKAMPYGYSEDEIHRAEKMEQAQLDEIRRLAYEEGYNDARKVKEVGTCTECVYEDRFDYQYPCKRCIRIASCGRDGDYYKAKEEDDETCGC